MKIVNLKVLYLIITLMTSSIFCNETPIKIGIITSQFKLGLKKDITKEGFNTSKNLTYLHPGYNIPNSLLTKSEQDYLEDKLTSILNAIAEEKGASIILNPKSNIQDFSSIPSLLLSRDFPVKNIISHGYMKPKEIEMMMNEKKIDQFYWVKFEVSLGLFPKKTTVTDVFMSAYDASLTRIDNDLIDKIDGIHLDTPNSVHYFVPEGFEYIDLKDKEKISDICNQYGLDQVIILNVNFERIREIKRKEGDYFTQLIHLKLQFNAQAKCFNSKGKVVWDEEKSVESIPIITNLKDKQRGDSPVNYALLPEKEDNQISWQLIELYPRSNINFSLENEYAPLFMDGLEKLVQEYMKI